MLKSLPRPAAKIRVSNYTNNGSLKRDLFLTSRCTSLAQIESLIVATKQLEQEREKKHLGQSEPAGGSEMKNVFNLACQVPYKCLKSA